MSCALLLSLLLTQSPTAGAAGVATETEDAKLKGFDLSLTVFNSSGVYFREGSYQNSLTFWFEPSYAFGRRFFKNTWFEHLSVNLRIPMEVRLGDASSEYGGTTYAPQQNDAAPVFNPDVASLRPGGPTANRFLLRDIFVQLAHTHLFTIPVLRIDVMSSIRFGLPTSTLSQTQGFITSIGPGLIFERRFFDRLSLGYMVRPTKFFFSRTHGGIRAFDSTSTDWRPTSTGVANADFMILNGVWAALDIAGGFGVSANYFTFNTKPFANNGGCNPTDIYAVDLCADGAALGNIQGQWRNDHWFLASLDYHRSFWSLSLGISTYRPMLSDSGRPSQPFFDSSGNNFTSIYLSFSASAEGLAGFAVGGNKQ